MKPVSPCSPEMGFWIYSNYSGQPVEASNQVSYMLLFTLLKVN